MNVLTRICTDKREHVTQRKASFPLSAIQEQLKDAPLPRSFASTLAQAQPGLIAEIKKASPSKGLIRHDFNPVTIARIYEKYGAACLSVLTDETYFQGHDTYLSAARNATALPVLRKDFMIDPYQIYESRLIGADCVLLIMAALDISQAAEMHALALELGMDVLVEVHDREELDHAMSLSPSMIGVNSRNLKTLEVDLSVAATLLGHIPAHVIKIAESGIHSHEDLAKLQLAGFQAFLVGESLMREQDIGNAVKRLLGKT